MGGFRGQRSKTLPYLQNDNHTTFQEYQKRQSRHVAMHVRHHLSGIPSIPHRGVVEIQRSDIGARTRTTRSILTFQIQLYLSRNPKMRRSMPVGFGRQIPASPVEWHRLEDHVGHIATLVAQSEDGSESWRTQVDGGRITVENRADRYVRRKAKSGQ